MVFRVLIFIFLFRTNGKKRHLDEKDFRTVMVVSPKCHSESHHSYVQSSFSKTMRLTEVLGKVKVAQKFESNFKDHCKKVNDISLIFIRFFFSQTNLVFKFNPVSIGVLDLLYFLSNIKRQRVVKRLEFSFKSFSLIFQKTFPRRLSCSCKTRNTARLISPQFIYFNLFIYLFAF